MIDDKVDMISRKWSSYRIAILIVMSLLAAACSGLNISEDSSQNNEKELRNMRAEGVGAFSRWCEGNGAFGPIQYMNEAWCTWSPRAYQAELNLGNTDIPDECKFLDFQGQWSVPALNPGGQKDYQCAISID
jgi:hypothetical protein